jgi:hypothetical protein
MPPASCCPDRHRQLAEHKMTKRNQLFLLCAFILAPLACDGSALTITFSYSTETGTPGSTLEYDADLINNTPSEIDLGAADVTLGGMLDVDPTPFLSGPATIAPGGSTGAFEIFTVTIPNTAGQDASNQGVLSITDLNDNFLGTALFNVVTSVPVTAPELSSGVLLLLALAVFSLLYATRVVLSSRRQ